MDTLRLRHYAWLWCLVATLAVGTVRADWTYTDDFAGKKAQRDSYAHSRFWSAEMTPLPEPYLYYQDSSLGGGLVFIDYEDQNAELSYCFPVGTAFSDRDIKGTLEFNLSFPSNSRISQQLKAGNFSYGLSGDGLAFSGPFPLDAGHHEIALTSLSGTVYIKFSGTRAVIKNLSVELYTPSTTIYVSPSSGTIQAAIDSAHDGDVIEVAAGTYSGAGNRDIDLRGKRITLRSASGPEATIIDCGTDGDGHRGFYFHEAEGADTIVSGFTVRRGRILGTEVPSNSSSWGSSSSYPVGGGIYCEFSSPSITNCIIEDCSAELGGGIGVVGGNPTITDSVITDCSGRQGAGIALIGSSNAIVTNCLVSDNVAYNDSQGGGIYCDESSAVLAGLEIAGNSAASYGGGLYCGGDNAYVLLKNCVLYNNTAATGAGLYTAWSGSSFSAQCQVEVVNCTVAGNELSGTTSGRAGGIQSSKVNITVNSSIVWDNEGSEIILSSPTAIEPVTYSNVQGGYSGTGNMNSDPLFVSAASGDFHLKSYHGRYHTASGQWVSDSNLSPCVDAGDPAISALAEPSPNGERVNMGAYGQTVQASMGTEYVIYHVDGTNGRDWNNGRSRDSAFAKIQTAVDTANTGDTVLVWPGTYAEEVFFESKAITVQSATDAAVIVGPDYAFRFYKAESSLSVLSNFIIRGCPTGAIYCDEGASPTLKNLTIVGNKYGIRVGYGNADPYIVSCILWGNSDGDLFECKAHYSCVQHGQVDKNAGNINTDPLFADPDNGDYHLRSRWGRYDPDTGNWVATDATTSPCINEGDPYVYPRAEPTPNGNRINMGAYGGTPYASLWNSPTY